MTAFLGSDQSAALVVCSLAEARRAGVADRAVFVWSGAEAVDVRFVSQRPDPGRSPPSRRPAAPCSRRHRQPPGARSDRRHRPDGHLLVLPVRRATGGRALGIATDDARD